MINLSNENLTEIDKYIIRFNTLSTAIDMLVGVTIRDNHKYGTTVCLRYGVLELRNFIKYRKEFLKIIDERRKKLVLNLDPLLDEIFKYESQIIYDRNNWIGHIKEHGDMIEEKNPKDDMTFEEHLRMLEGVIRFREGISKIFFKEYDNLARNFSKDEDEIFGKNETRTPIELFLQESRNRVELVNKKLTLDNAGFHLDIQHM